METGEKQVVGLWKALIKRSTVSKTTKGKCRYLWEDKEVNKDNGQSQTWLIKQNQEPRSARDPGQSGRKPEDVK